MKLRTYCFCVGLVFAACGNPQEKLAEKRKDAAVETQKAAENVQKTQAEAAEKIKNSEGAKAVDQAKIDATKDIANAKKELGDAKVDATKTVADAEQKAKTDPNPQVP